MGSEYPKDEKNYFSAYAQHMYAVRQLETFLALLIIPASALWVSQEALYVGD